MRISDWSSDVCSSDLLRRAVAAVAWRSLTAFGMKFFSNRASDGGHGSVGRRGGSAAAEFRLAAFEERARAFAHVVGGEHQADRKSTRLNSSHYCAYRMPSSA